MCVTVDHGERFRTGRPFGNVSYDKGHALLCMNVRCLNRDYRSNMRAVMNDGTK